MTSPTIARFRHPATTTSLPITGGPNLCPIVVGTPMAYDESIDNDLTKLNGGGGINPNYLPRDPNNGCKPVYPHEYLRVNTIFEVVKANGGSTAWIDKHPSYEWTKGPSGKGVDDFYGPEINSIPVALPQFLVAARCRSWTTRSTMDGQPTSEIFSATTCCTCRR